MPQEAESKPQPSLAGWEAQNVNNHENARISANGHDKREQEQARLLVAG